MLTPSDCSTLFHQFTSILTKLYLASPKSFQPDLNKSLFVADVCDHHPPHVLKYVTPALPPRRSRTVKDDYKKAQWFTNQRVIQGEPRVYRFSMDLSRFSKILCVSTIIRVTNFCTPGGLSSISPTSIVLPTEIPR
jgi:hypothetical protein